MKEKMRSKRWGVFNHYICTPGTDRHYVGFDLSDWNKTVDSFDVEKHAYTLHEMGVGYYFITLNHGTEYVLGPNKAYERYLKAEKDVPCSHRDLVDDLYHALSKYDIDLCLYFNCLSPFNYSYGEKYRNVLGIELPPTGGLRDVLRMNDCDTFVANWAEVLHEYADRYGEKVKMWWLDSCYQYAGYTPEMLKKYHDAIKLANPNALIAYNRGELRTSQLVKYMDFEDFTCGEKIGFDYIPKTGDIQGSLAHLLIPIGCNNPEFWGPWLAAGTDHTNEELKDYLRQVNEVGGIVTFDIRVLPDGSIDPSHIEALRGI